MAAREMRITFTCSATTSRTSPVFRGGYRPLNAEPFMKEALSARGYKRLFPAKTLSEWHERNRCPVNDRLCEEAVWLTQTMLLAPRGSMESIAGAIRKIQKNADRLPKA